MILIAEGQAMPELSSSEEDTKSIGDSTPYQRSNEEQMTKEKESNAGTIGKYYILMNFELLLLT